MRSASACLASHLRVYVPATPMLQLACVQHFLQQPLSCLAAAAASGSRRKLRLAIKRLSYEQFHSCLKALSSAMSRPSARIAQAPLNNALLGTAVGGCAPSASSSPALDGTGRQLGLSAQQQTACAHLQSALNGNCSDDVKAAAAAVLEGSLWGALGAFQLWQLGLLIMSIVAKFTGRLLLCLTRCSWGCCWFPIKHRKMLFAPAAAWLYLNSRGSLCRTAHCLPCTCRHFSLTDSAKTAFVDYDTIVCLHRAAWYIYLAQLGSLRPLWHYSRVMSSLMA